MKHYMIGIMIGINKTSMQQLNMNICIKVST
jgi:hypothetical protein